MNQNQILTKLNTSKNKIDAPFLCKVFQLAKFLKPIITEVYFTADPKNSYRKNAVDYSIFNISTKNGAYKFKMPTALNNDFLLELGQSVKPHFDIAPNYIQFADGFLEELKKVAKFAKIKSHDYYRDLIQLEFKGNRVAIVYTNSHLLYKSKDFYSSFEGTKNFVINASRDYAKFDFFVPDGESYYINGQMFKINEDHKFPNYEYLMNFTAENTFTYMKNNLKKALSLAKINSLNGITKLHLNGTIEFQSVENNIHSYSIHHPYLHRTGEATLDIGININYMNVINNAFERDAVTMLVRASHMPIMFTANDGTQAFVMPCMA